MANRNPKAQIAVIITFVIAAIFLFAIVFINLARISNIKTLTSQVADRSALQIASQIGSMSHNLKENVLGGHQDQCETSWVALGAILAGIIIIIVTAGFGLPLSVGLIGLGIASFGLLDAYSSSLPLNEAINEQFKGMTTYNGIREAALYQALGSLQTDDTLLRPSGHGIFFDDIDQDTVKDPGEPEYDLNKVEAMKNAKKTGRFFAWYYKKRLPLVSDEPLGDKIDGFLDELRSYIEFYDWDAVNWINKKASFVVGPVSVTCSSCPSWVYDAAGGRVTVLTIDEGNKDGKGYYIPSGFLREKFFSQGQLLDENYGVSFCGWSLLRGRTCDEVDALIEDLNMLVARSKELVDLPVSLRFQAIDSWMPLFYDLKYDRSKSKDDEYRHDIYDRLTRDENELKAWIDELKTLKGTIASEIEDDHGTYCEQGRGVIQAQCYTTINACYCSHMEDTEDGKGKKVCDGDNCQDLKEARWWGDYGTCTGDGFSHNTHPVCQGGDLYGTIPFWCSELRARIDCKKNSFCGGRCQCCNIPPTNAKVHKSYRFQGQLAWDNTSGPTEVAQAIEILETLVSDISVIKVLIENFAREVSLLLPRGDPIRNEIVYAWTDKEERTGKERYSHLVAVKLMNYPEDLPYIKPEERWKGLQKCLVLRGGSKDDGSGDLEIITWRYDEDRPTPWWTMRLRKKPAEEQFNKSKLAAIIADIQDNAKIDITRADVNNLLDNYAVTSKAKVEYWPEKDKIKIVETK